MEIVVSNPYIDRFGISLKGDLVVQTGYVLEDEDDHEFLIIGPPPQVVDNSPLSTLTSLGIFIRCQCLAER